MANPYSQPSRFTYEAPDLPWEKYATMLEKKQQEFDTNQSLVEQEKAKINFNEGKLTQGKAKERNDHYISEMSKIAENYKQHKNPQQLTKDMTNMSLAINNDPLVKEMSKDAALSPAAWQTEAQNQSGAFAWKVKDQETGQMRDMTYDEYKSSGQPMEYLYGRSAGSPKFDEEMKYFDNLKPEVDQVLGGIKSKNEAGIQVWYTDDSTRTYSTFEDAAKSELMLKPEFAGYLQTNFQRNNTPSTNYYNLSYGQTQEGLENYVNDYVQTLRPMQYDQKNTDRKIIDKFNPIIDAKASSGTTEQPPASYIVQRTDTGVNLQGLESTDLAEGAEDPQQFINQYNTEVESLLQMQTDGKENTPEYQMQLDKVSTLTPYYTEVLQLSEAFDNSQDNIDKYNEFFKKQEWSNEYIQDLNEYKMTIDKQNIWAEIKDFNQNDPVVQKNYEVIKKMHNKYGDEVINSSLEKYNDFYNDNIKEEREKYLAEGLKNVKGLVSYKIPTDQGIDTDKIHSFQRSSMQDLVQTDAIDFGNSIYHITNTEGDVENVELNDKAAKTLLTNIVSPDGSFQGLINNSSISLDVSDNNVFISFRFNGRIDEDGNIITTNGLSTQSEESKNMEDYVTVKMKLNPDAAAKEIEGRNQGPLSNFLSTFEYYSVPNSAGEPVVKFSDKHGTNFATGIKAQIIKQAPISRKVNMKNMLYGQNAGAAMQIWGEPNVDFKDKAFLSMESTFQRLSSDKLGTIIYRGNDANDAQAVDLEYMMNNMKDFKFQTSATAVDDKVNISDPASLSFFYGIATSILENDILKNTSGNIVSDIERGVFMDEFNTKIQTSSMSVADVLAMAQNRGFDLNSVNKTAYIFGDSEMSNSFLYSGSGKK